MTLATTVTETPSLLHHRFAPLAAGVAGLAGAGYLSAVDPTKVDYLPSCPFRTLTGLDCPGCGSTRALDALVSGDVLHAMDHNVLVVLAVPLLALAYFAWVRRAWRGTPSRWTIGAAPGFAIAALFSVFWVVRNLPLPFLEVLHSSA